MRCANCKLPLFYGIEDMILHLDKDNRGHPYDLYFCDSDMYTSDYSRYKEWCVGIDSWHNWLFDKVFGTSEVATINYMECPDCGHINEYQSFVINDEIIVNLR